MKKPFEPFNVNVYNLMVINYNTAIYNKLDYESVRLRP
jgi:hypothetical protein